MSGRGFCDYMCRLPSVMMMGERARQEYFDRIMAGSEVMDTSLTWTCEWFKEQLPLESSSGQSLEVAWFNSVCLGGAGDNPGEYPQGSYGTAPGIKVLVFPDSYGYCDGILAAGTKWGRVAETKIVTKAPSSIKLEDMLQYLEPGWDLIIFGTGIDTPADNSVSEVMSHQNAVIKLYLTLLQGIMKKARATKKLVCITCDIFAEEAEIHEEVGVGLVTCAGLWGLSNSARLELDVPVHVVDTEWALQEESMPYLASEIFRESTFGKNTVRVLNSGRYVARHMPTQPYEVSGAQFELPIDGIIAITGGNGALAMVMGQYLLAKVEEALAKGKAKGSAAKCQIKFLSRSAKISDQNLPGWKAIEERAQRLGVKAEQCKCDIGSREQVESFVTECAPNLRGVLHAAGVLQDAMLFNQTWEKYEMVFDPKSRAALYLHEALEKDENPGLEFFWLFSSTAVYGNPSATNYSCANAYLDALARHRKAMGKPALAIQWSSWAEAGMAANLTGAARERVFSSAQPPFSNVEGISGLEAGLRTALPCFSVNKWNAVALLGQSFQLEVPAILRNFTSSFVPNPPESLLGGNQDIYSMYSDAMGLGDNLVYSTLVEPTETCDLIARAVKEPRAPRRLASAAPAPATQVDFAAAEESGDDTADESEEPSEPIEARIAARCEAEKARPPYWQFVNNDVLQENNSKRAPGLFYGIEFPWNADMLAEFGPRWLTRAFHKAGTLPKNNKVTRVTVDKSVKVDAGNNASKFLFDVQYMWKADYLHTQLFAKIPFPFDGTTLTDRLSSSVNKQPMDLYEINTYRVLESSLPVKTPRFYFGDISNMTTNFILITERVPFAELGGRREDLGPYEVEGPYEKCKDWMLRPPAKAYYLLTFQMQARIAGAHKSGWMGSQDFLRTHGLQREWPDPENPGLWGVNPAGSTGVAAGMARKKLEACLRFMSGPAKVIFPAYVAEETYQQKFVDTMLKYQAYLSEINYFKEHNPDYVALGHMNLNMDNAYFWRDESGNLDCGLLDWGGFSSNSIPHKLYWELNCAEFEDIAENLDEYINAFVEEYQRCGGPWLDHDTVRTGIVLTSFQNLYFMVESVPNCLRQCPEKEWATIQDRYDPRISANVGGKSTLRTTLQAMLNGVRIIEELKGDEVLEGWVQSFWTGVLQLPPKSEAIIKGE